MHERSLAQALIQQIDDEIRTRALRRLREVHLEIGEFAGVEPRLLASAFEELATNHWPIAVQLQWKSVPLTARCRSCVQEFRVERFRFVCPVCGHRQVDITAGEEIKLVGLRADTTSPQMSGFP
jgi:hydrogenase nickel incorporation protein HypA/HybF